MMLETLTVAQSLRDRGCHLAEPNETEPDQFVDPDGIGKVGQSSSGTRPMPASLLSARPHASEIVDVLLKTPEVLFGKSNLLGVLFGILLLGHLLFGVIVGSYSGTAQWLAAPTKIVLGTIVAGLLCLPSLYIFACLSGARIKLGQVASLLCGALALTSIMLLGFAPVAFIFTFSTDSLVAMGVLHIVIWLVAIGFGIRFVIRGVTACGGRASGFIRAWALIFVLCLLQMSTTLRPILGHSDTLLSNEKQLFVHHWLKQIRSDQTEQESQSLQVSRR